MDANQENIAGKSHVDASNQSRTNDSAIRSLFVAHPWITSAVSMLVICALLPLVGIMELSSARTLLFCGLFLECLIWLAMLMFLGPAGHNNRKDALGCVSALIVAGVAGLFNLGNSGKRKSVAPIRGARPPLAIIAGRIGGEFLKTPPGKPGSENADESPGPAVRVPTIPRRAISGQATLAYWQTTVAMLHALRFSEATTTDRNQPVIEFLRSEVVKLKQALTAAELRPEQGVDRELVLMVHRHGAFDRQSLLFFEQMIQLLDSEPAAATMTMEQSETWMKENLEKLGELPFDKLPPKVQQVLLAEESLADQSEKVFEEIESMREKLNQRYQPMQFTLPPIAGE